MDSKVEIIWSVENIKKILSMGVEAKLSRFNVNSIICCDKMFSLYLFFMKTGKDLGLHPLVDNKYTKNTNASSKFNPTQQIINLTNYHTRNHYWETLYQIPQENMFYWTASLLTVSGVKNETNNSLGNSRLLATCNELRNDDNDIFINDTLRIRVNLWKQNTGTLRSNKIIARSRCGMTRIVICDVENFSSLKGTGKSKDYDLVKMHYDDTPVVLRILIRKELIVSFLCSVNNGGCMLLQAVYWLNSAGEKNALWKGETAVSISQEFRIPQTEALTRQLHFPNDKFTLCFHLIDLINGSSCVAESVVEGGDWKMQDLIDLSQQSDEKIDTCPPSTHNSEKDHNDYPLRSDLHSLLQKETLSDFVLRCGSESFPVHRALLCARSPVFEAMLTAPMREAWQGAADLSDFRLDTVRRLVRFLYTDAVADLGPDSALELYSAADKYAVLALRDRCSEVLASGLSARSVLSVLSLSDRHGDGDLRKKSVDYIFGNEKKVFKSTQWAAFMKEDPCLAIQVAHDLNMKRLNP